MVKNFNKKIVIRSIFLFISVLALFLILFIRRADAASAKSDPTYISIEVKKGENLTEIAGRYNERSIQSDSSYIDTVMDLNNMLEPDELKAGKHIVIPVYLNNH